MMVFKNEMKSRNHEVHSEANPDDQFMRMHKSYIVAIDKIQAVRGSEICIQVKDIDKYIPIGITFKEKVLKQLRIVE